MDTLQPGLERTAPPRRVVKDQAGYVWATGRRKTSTARVRVRPGTGTFLVNGRELKDYFPDVSWRDVATLPLTALGREKEFDVLVRVNGGGLTGQSGAVALGIARAIQSLDGEAGNSLREKGLFTRDSRMKERKKYGQRGARRAFQFSKR